MSEELNNIIKNVHGSIENRINAAYNLGRKEGYKQPCPDAISRSDMLDAVGHGTTYTSEELQKIIKALPPVNAQQKYEDIAKAFQFGMAFGFGEKHNKMDKVINEITKVITPQPKTGHWIFDEILDMHYYCSECKSMGVDYWDFCPYCGAKMIESQESEG